MKVMIVVLSLVLAAGIGLLVYLELDRRSPETPAQSQTAASSDAAQDTTEAPTQADPAADAATDPENPLNTQPPAVTIPEAEPNQDTPQVPVQGVDPMDPQGATEGPEVDPELGADETVDPTENELPIVGE